jgi:hypothetical protein
VNFGLKPTLRIIQAIVYRGTRSIEPAYAVAVKQLYSSHYFETAICWHQALCSRSTGQTNSIRG